MSPAIGSADLLAQLPQFAFAAILILSRVGSACMMLPGIGEMELPMMIRAGFVLVFTTLLVPVLLPDMPPTPADLPDLVLMLIGELVTGVWLGWLTRLVLLALPMAGQIIAGAIGMTNVLQPDPMLGPSAAALSRLLGLAAPVLVLASGLYAYPIAAVIGSYHLVAAGHMLPVGDTVAAFLSALSEAFGLALRLAAPFLLGTMLFHGSFAVVGRLVPHLQTFFAAMPGQIVCGLLLLGLLSGLMAQTWMDAALTTFSTLPGL